MDKLLFDSHTHINNESYKGGERDALMARIDASAVAYAVDVGFNMCSSRLAIADAAAYPWCFAAVGVHPHDAGLLTAADLDELRGLLREPKVVALGEIGLDYHYDRPPKDVQRDAFRKQLVLALEQGVPVVIHGRESGGETVSILKEEGAFSEARKALFAPRPKTGTPDARVLLHCFSGSAEQALEYIALGCTISIAGPVSYKNNKKTVEVVRAVPLEYMLIETDAPYLTPEPLRGQPNESPYVEYVARKIAEIKGVSYEEVCAETLENAKRFFGI